MSYETGFTFNSNFVNQQYVYVSASVGSANNSDVSHFLKCVYALDMVRACCESMSLRYIYRN